MTSAPNDRSASERMLAWSLARLTMIRFPSSGRLSDFLLVANRMRALKGPLLARPVIVNHRTPMRSLMEGRAQVGIRVVREPLLFRHRLRSRFPGRPGLKATGQALAQAFAGQYRCEFRESRWCHPDERQHRLVGFRRRSPLRMRRSEPGTPRQVR